jgi:hypothetical protein
MGVGMSKEDICPATLFERLWWAKVWLSTTLE